MKKLLIVLAFASVSLGTFAQEEDPTLKYSVATNSFWSNWFIQVGAQWTATYTSAEHGKGLGHSPFKGFRSTPNAAIAIGKWFTPGIGLRTKLTGIWGQAYDDDFHYWNLQEQALLNLSNLFCGYNPSRVWNFSVFGGAGVFRNCSYDSYGMALSLGILNQWYVSRKVAINLEIGWNRFENDYFSGNGVNGGSHGLWESHDELLYAELGLTFNLGKGTWEKTPDVDAIKALSQAQIDALNAQLADANAENARLKDLLANQKPAPAPEPQIIKEVNVTPVSVFFNINKAVIASKKDLVNVKTIADYAQENDATVLVTGYADSATGTAEYNQALSEKRAETVADELVNMGVSRDNIQTVGKGGVSDLSPVSYNRRATVEIAK